MHFNICSACFSAITSLATLKVLQFLFGRHVVVLLPCYNHAAVLLPAALHNSDIYLAFLPAFTRLLCDVITSKAKGTKTVKAQTFTRNQESL